MIRLSNIQLPLDHDASAIEHAILSLLDIPVEKLVRFTVFRRGYDARKKSNIFLIYTIDVETTCDQALLSQFADHQQVKIAPDLNYHPVAQAPENLTERPIIIGFGPCGLLAALVLAQMGYKPIVLERGKEVRERTKDTFGFWRKKSSTPSPTCNLVKAVQGLFLTVSSIAK
ncbi:hypothetical protein [Marinomonas rhodophyticola]|uniref:FAD binding domain-containing protein n=1 Tax=Marinomonas rhodophyticola TaxID=2992803 RepID=A0ABT3KBA5_9GAMM|nr:hypothetical protein [Marinomonas sp. KJ51-3]MCW4627817.1 hypothetical protein [Marinomonas sp. KJ51-3]